MNTGTNALCVALKREEHDLRTLAVKVEALGQAARLKATCRQVLEVCRLKADQRFYAILEAEAARQRRRLSASNLGAIALCVVLRHSDEIEGRIGRSSGRVRATVTLKATCTTVEACMRDASPYVRRAVAAAWRRARLRGLRLQRAAAARPSVTEGRGPAVL